jgi:coenzyme F420-0:L-glutamate ligase / coenzyme F420-1:gamma-L-glutamate ligase
VARSLESLSRNEDNEPRVIVNPLRSGIVKPGDRIIDMLLKALDKKHLRLRNKDIVAVSSKIVAISENRIRALDSVRPTERALTFARKYSLDPPFAQIVLDEADIVVGGVKGALLTVRNGDAVANAGIDQKNAPPNTVVLWPVNPDRSARKIQAAIKRFLGKDVGVVIVDSRVSPLRLGTTGFAIGSAGFRPVKDVRGELDLSGRKVRITFHALADGIAAAAQLTMGETAERTPFVVIRGAPATFGSREGIRSAKLAWNQCLFMSQMNRSAKIVQ